MVIGFIFLFIALLCLAGFVRSIKQRNFFAAGYAIICCLVIGWFSIYSLIDVFQGGGVPVGG